LIFVPCPLKPGLLCPAGRVCGEACICPLTSSQMLFTINDRVSRGTRLYEQFDAPREPAPAGVPR